MGDNTQGSEHPPDQRRPVLLMVEDVAHFHRYVQSLMKFHGVDADLVSATTLREAKEKLLCGEHTFLLLDYRLPDGNADSLLGFMDEHNLRIPYLIVTQFKKDELISKGISADFVERAAALVFKSELGIWFGGYIKYLLKTCEVGYERRNEN